MATFMVTGAGRGIGLEMARQLAVRGETVIATVRGTDPPALRELGVRCEAMDVADAASVAALARRLEGASVDVLVNNAGVGGPGAPFPEVDLDDAERLYRINALGPLRVCQALLPNVLRGERKLVVNVTSRMGSVSDNGSGGYYAYRASKAALNMLTRSMALDLASRGITCFVIHPGWVKTDMGGAAAPLSVTQSVAGMLGVIDRAGPAMSGTFLDHAGAPIPW